VQKNFDIRYLFPNFFTAASLFLGVLSIIASIHTQFEKAAFFIFISLILDGLDGRIARLANATSKFGVEFDSLADLVAFGVAPAILLYQAIGFQFGKFGVLVAALFVVLGAIRLARFNVMSPLAEPSVFLGVPIPTAAVFVTSWVLLVLKYKLMSLAWVVLIFSLFVAFLMVSNIRYPSFKKIDLKHIHIIRVLVVVVLFFGLLYLFPIETFVIASTLFLFLGVVRAIYYLVKKRRVGV